MDYVGRSPIIINHTITVANVWQQASSAIKGVRKFMIKARETTDNSFDWAFKDNPTEWMSNGGQGVAFDGCEMPDFWVRSSTINTIIEICYWN